MTLKDAHQTLAGYNPAFFAAFNYAIFEIPYRDLRDDWLKGEDKQIYRSEINEHLLFDLMDFRRKLYELHKAMRKIANSNNWTFLAPHFKHVFSTLDSRALQHMREQHLMVG